MEAEVEMNALARTFEVRQAARESVPLLVGVMGCSGSGKTFSALRLATGIQAVMGGDIYGIDTEARRMLHYADQFKFRHLQFDPPHGSLDYLAAIEHCIKAGAKIIVIDSMSHEHSGVGGMIDFQEKELDRLAGDDWGKRERVKMLAWQKPKAARRKLIDRVLQINATFVFCFRARETVKPVKVNGKTEIVPMGFMPIAGDEFLFEQTVNCLLLPKSNGVPTWQSENVGERQMMKLPEHFRSIFAEQAPLSEDIGRALATWARGGSVSSPGLQKAAADQPAPSANAGGMQQRGAGEVVLTWEEYNAQWDVMLDAESATAQLLASAWNSDGHKHLRKNIAWPEGQREALTKRVSDKIAALKVPA